MVCLFFAPHLHTHRSRSAVPRHHRTRRIQIKLLRSPAVRRARDLRADGATADVGASVRTRQARHGRGAEAEGTPAVALLVVLDVEIGQDGRSGLRGEGLHVRGAELGCHAVVGEEKGEGVAGAEVLETADVLIG